MATPELATIGCTFCGALGHTLLQIMLDTTSSWAAGNTCSKLLSCLFSSHVLEEKVYLMKRWRQPGFSPLKSLTVFEAVVHLFSVTSVFPLVSKGLGRA